MLLSIPNTIICNLFRPYQFLLIDYALHQHNVIVNVYLKLALLYERITLGAKSSLLPVKANTYTMQHSQAVISNV